MYLGEVIVGTANQFKVHVVRVLKDNFSFIVHDTVSKSGILIDPAEPLKLRPVVTQIGVTICGILNTHHHWYLIEYVIEATF
jgi:glyoxylase-like metal-dependent hydrolase (beta-lactamase superfamily II)